MKTFQPLPCSIKQQWINALTSGIYTQGTLYLEKDGLNCCLGVLCRTTGIQASLVQSLFGESCYAFGGQGQYTLLDEFVRKQLGLCENAMAHLIKMNDKDGASFHQIAQWIKENL